MRACSADHLLTLSCLSQVLCKMRVLPSLLLFLPLASSFLLPTPPSSSLARRGAPVKMMPASEVASLVSTLVADTAAADDFVYGAVEAPGWVLPLGAIIVLGSALAVPLALRPGTEAFEEEKSRLEGLKTGQTSRRGQSSEQEDE